MNRVQTLRSAITGWRPIAGTRQPGELYVNWADAAFGTINVAQTAMDLIAVRFWSAQANYAAGSHVIYNGELYKALVPIAAGAFNPAQWGGIVVGGIAEAPLDGRQYGRQSSAWTVIPAVPPDAPSDGHTYGRKNAAWAATLADAPLDGQLYGRKSAAWVAVSGGGGGIPEAPNDGQQYGRQSAGWTVVATGAGIPDAPNDGTSYARKSAAWSHLTHSDITDWTATLGGYLALSGGTMSGPIASGTVAADPTVALGIASKQYVDAHGGGGSGANILDNGDMSIYQRGDGTVNVPTGQSFHIDRWAAYATHSSRYQVGQSTTLAYPPAGFSFLLAAKCISATSVGSTDYFAIQQGIEGVSIAGLSFGFPTAPPVTLSFWVNSSVAGTFSGSLSNGANNRCYVFTYAIPVANTPTPVVITIPGDTAGTWITYDNNPEMFLVFDLGSGSSNRSSTINSWVAGDFVGQTGSAGIMGNNGAQWYVTSVKLEIGGAATPYAYDPIAIRLARCQRYYQELSQVTADGYGGSGFITGTNYCFPMRSGSPTAVLSSISYSNANSISVLGVGNNSIIIGANATGSGHSYATATAAMSAEI